MTTPAKYITVERPEQAHPTWLPVDGPPWRLVDPYGTFVRDSDGYSLRFPSDDEALKWMQIHNVQLLPPRY